jgi:tetratricopeptide (TPR) repeat protein
MSVMLSPDDTQPVKSVDPAYAPTINPYDDGHASGIGCVPALLLSVAMLVFAALIIFLAGLAGWRSGETIAGQNATATQNAVIVDQLNRIPGDISSANTFLLERRLAYLTTLTPAVAGLENIVQTATAVYLTVQPTLTPTSSPTLPPTVTPTPVPTQDPALITPGAPTSAFDLNALLQEAELAAGVGDYTEAIRTFDAIQAIDPTFESARVREALLTALIAEALSLFRGGEVGSLAEAIRLTDRAREIDTARADEQLSYESYIASLYLSAYNAIGIDYNLSTRNLLAVYNVAPNYRDTLALLINEYVAYGDALLAGAQPCAAVGPYTSALNISNSGSVVGKRDAAQNACFLSQTQVFVGTPGPGTVAPVGVAPIGVPPTPG